MKFELESVPLFDVGDPEPDYIVRSTIEFKGIVYEHSERFSAWQWEGFPEDLRMAIQRSAKENLSKIIARHIAQVSVTREA